MVKEKKVSIISLGWLGQELYKNLEKQGYKVFGTYHNSPKGFSNELQYDFNNDDIPPEVLNSDFIVFNLPPSKITNIERLDFFIKRLSNQKLIFISSTSVYGSQGNVDESTPPKPETKNGIFLFESEELIKKCMKSYFIIRSAGQIGGDRHPGRFLSGRKNLDGGKSLVNLVSRIDLIEIINKVILKNENIIVNAVNSSHPTKKDYYTKYCEDNKLPIPHYHDADQGSENKVISTRYNEFFVSTKLI